jgi:hypothetical protein
MVRAASLTKRSSATPGKEERIQMSRRFPSTLAVLACAGMFTFTGPGAGLAAAASAHNRPALIVRHNATAHPASTLGFLAHAGLAYYVFDHYIYKPYKAGDLTHGFTHKLKLVEAGLAAVFVYHEMKLAITDVKGSKLAFLAVPITALVAKLSGLGSKLGGGDTSALSGVEGDLGAIQSQAGAKGFNIKQIQHSI